MKIQMSQISPNIGDLKDNFNYIKQEISIAYQNNADVVVFPELATIGYPPRDLLYDHKIWVSHDKLIKEILAFIQLKNHITVIFGGIHQVEKPYGQFARYNAAFIIDKTYGIRIVHKKLLPSYDVFNESIYFTPCTEKILPIPIIHSEGIEYCDVLICEDMWNFKHKGTDKWMSAQSYQIDPVSELKGNGTIFIINASPFWHGKIEKTHSILEDICNTLNRPVCWVNQIGGYDELIFGGYSIFVSKSNSKIIHTMCFPFKQDRIIVNSEHSESNNIAKHYFENTEDRDLDNMLSALELGLKEYCHRNGFKKVVFGCSGGIDSALVGAIACRAIGSENVTAITMPSEFSSVGSWSDSEQLCNNLHMQLLNWNIKKIHEEFRSTVLKDKIQFRRTVTDENIMPRARAVLLMAYSNDENALLVSTSNKSEASVGYTTLFGDCAAGYSLIGDVWKTQVYALSRYINKISGREIIPQSIIDKEPSAELSHGQKDTDSLPPYCQLDPILIDLIENGLTIEETMKRTSIPDQVMRIVRMIENSEFKRAQMPPCPKLSLRSFGRGRDIPISKKISYV